MPLKRAPRGWKRIDVVPEGAIVVEPKSSQIRRKAFSGHAKNMDAFADDGIIYVYDAQIWFRNETLQVHERTHIRQEQEWGYHLLNRMYDYCDKLVGYDHNPFEVEARNAEKALRRNKNRKQRRKSR